MRWIIQAAIVLAAMIAAAGGASAAVCFDPPSTCVGGTEQMIFLESASGVTTGFGTLGSQGPVTIQFTSPSVGGNAAVPIDLANGFSTITPSSPGTSFPALNINTVGGQTITDLDFSVQLFNNTTVASCCDLTITAKNGSTVEGTQNYTGLMHDSDMDFLIVSTLPLTEVDLTSDTGIKEYKQLTVSGLTPSAVPLPPSIALFGSVLVGAFLFSRKKRKSNVSALA